MFNKDLCKTCNNKNICKIRSEYDAHYLFIKMRDMSEEFRIECKYYVEEDNG